MTETKKIVPRGELVRTEVLRLEKLTAEYLYDISICFDKMYGYGHGRPYRMVEGFDSDESQALSYLSRILPPGENQFIISAIKFARTPWYERKEEVGGRLT